MWHIAALYSQVLRVAALSNIPSKWTLAGSVRKLMAWTNHNLLIAQLVANRPSPQAARLAGHAHAHAHAAQLELPRRARRPSQASQHFRWIHRSIPLGLLQGPVGPEGPFVYPDVTVSIRCRGWISALSVELWIASIASRNQSSFPSRGGQVLVSVSRRFPVYRPPRMLWGWAWLVSATQDLNYFFLPPQPRIGWFQNAPWQPWPVPISPSIPIDASLSVNTTPATR